MKIQKPNNETKVLNPCHNLKELFETKQLNDKTMKNVQGGGVIQIIHSTGPGPVITH